MGRQHKLLQPVLLMGSDRISRSTNSERCSYGSDSKNGFAAAIASTANPGSGT